MVRSLPPPAVRRPRRGRSRALALLTAGLLVLAPSVLAAPGDLTPYPVPTPDSMPHGIAVGADGVVWFTERTAGKVASFDPTSGAFDETDLPDPTAEPTAIAVGADGSAWFTLQAGNAIGRLVPAGGYAEYALPIGGSMPAGIAAAADGTVWFTERFGHHIGRIAPDGTITRWAPPTGVSGPTGITLGPDGAVWFTEQRASKIGRFDPASETFEEFDVPAFSSPTSLAFAPDGQLWVTLRMTNMLARLDPADGSVVTFGVPTVGANPTSIVAGPDGAMWFSETAVGQLGRAALDGVVTEIPLGGFTSPQGLAAHGGSVWVAEAVENRISSLEVEVADLTAPTIDLRAPVAGDWTVVGGELPADFECADEGGSGLASCVAPVDHGAAVAATSLGTHGFTVLASDGAGNLAEATGGYLVFGAADGTALGGSARPGEGLTLSLDMGLAPKADPFVTATSAPVDCATGAPLGPSEAADTRLRIAHHGSLEVRWLTSRAWGGSCRALTLAFDADGWSGTPATFGAVAF